jgi:hypothetical protein
MIIESIKPRPIQNPPVPRERIIFSHPSEAELARILDFYGIEWRYEPITFPLEWDQNGNILEAFSPDFYLVEQDLFVELTTLQPKLMRIKHQKLRRIKELYPTLNIRLWSRKDFIHLMEHLGLEERGQALVGKEAVRES